MGGSVLWTTYVNGRKWDVGPMKRIADGHNEDVVPGVRHAMKRTVSCRTIAMKRMFWWRGFGAMKRIEALIG